MSFLNDCSLARVQFAKKVKAAKVDPGELKIYADFDTEEKLCFVYAEDKIRDVRAVQSFPLNPAAWNLKLKREIEKLFRGSALIAVRGR